MSSTDYVVKSLPAVRLAARHTTVADEKEIGKVVGPMFDDVARHGGKSSNS